ncbi:hypothetical protein NHQ30_005215 [Ciborinia camelliae]|nr:hypothetical protein NHQ30_005215 [Ciborinia camelliae]
MASSKEIQHSSRPGQARLTLSTNSGSNPRQPHSRNHSVPGGSLIPSSKVTRRKSVSSNVSNVAALVAAARETGDNCLAMPISTRRATMSKNASRPAPMYRLPSPPSSLPTHKIRSHSTMTSPDHGESAIDDDNNDEEMEDDEDEDSTKNRTRRASEGSQLLKDGKKANANDLKCEKCGKGYKHSSCLTKHRWEHTSEWSITSKFLISKHQQVQILEAATVLMEMNQNTPPDSAKGFQSDDQDSASPAASGSDDHEINRASSADTTPPSANMRQAYGSYNSSKSYPVNGEYHIPSGRSTSGGSFSIAFGHSRQQSHEHRPQSSGMNGNQEDEGLTSAIKLLSCGFASPGTPLSGLLIPEDIPPVPDIPAEYRLDDFTGSFTPSFPRQRESFARESFTRGSYDRHQIHRDGDVQMEDGDESVGDEDDYDQRSRGRSDEDDDGVFGRMEE